MVVLIALILAVIICLYALSTSGHPSKYIVPLWFKRGVQPRDLFSKKYYVVGHLDVLSDDLRRALGDTVEVRDIGCLVEDSVVLMAPVSSWTLAKQMRKWEVTADLAREASHKPILFVGPSQEKIGDYTLGIGEIPGVTKKATGDEIVFAVDNIYWRISRRKRYRNDGYSAAEIPVIVAIGGAGIPRELAGKLRRRKDIVVVDTSAHSQMGSSSADIRAMMSPSDVRKEIDDVEKGTGSRTKDDSSHSSHSLGVTIPRMVVLCGYRADYWGLPDYIYGVTSARGVPSYADLVGLIAK